MAHGANQIALVDEPHGEEVADKLKAGGLLLFQRELESSFVDHSLGDQLRDDIVLDMQNLNSPRKSLLTFPTHTDPQL
jgi:hypothetical protein